ncbi:outer kinetochore KNL1 complex subunit KNL1 [Enoplosus armatus]|uniref:outer kinetochore KNL1 complex subunit KNL1 n=1 Tax=Enoplosus armatus TaxID=215367 RepID=UPI00399375B7
MDMTEAQTGRIQGFTDDDDDDDAFQCLFPTQEMYSHFDNTPRVSQTAEKNKRQQSSKTLASSNSKAFKQSLFESQLEDYASDTQRKLDDGTITVLEFFKLFNIDFVIHNPRQSILPGRLLSDTDRTPMDLLKDQHINRPKQMVYETNVQNLTEKVEGLKERMQDLDKPLKSVNRPLWEEMRNSSEKGLKSFGAKLKERNNLFRKTSKVQSHEMKEVLYSNLVQANLEEQQRLMGTIEGADEMMKSLDDCIRELETVNEWKFGEKRNNSTVYTFLHETLHLQLVYEKSNGDDAEKESERKISRITFKLQLDDEKSQCHACLVHQLLSQYVEGETSWVEKYPTSRHVPKLLHDVGLVVSRCRLLGEELRLLKMWGGLRLNILNISCVDTQVHVVFSSLKKCSKFEVIFSVTLINHLCVLQVQSFKNMIGSTTIQQIEEIVASFSPAKNLLTKIVKKIHENLLR